MADRKPGNRGGTSGSSSDKPGSSGRGSSSKDITNLGDEAPGGTKSGSSRDKDDMSKGTGSKSTSADQSSCRTRASRSAADAHGLTVSVTPLLAENPPGTSESMTNTWA